ncbi:MAG: ATP-binding protein [Sphingomonadales bacterium]|nr:ATP-binding protein [Sphingomonadales bacterium]MDE2171554.1 ATP-binding protein [Sphingomonadales bacterium]
MINNASVRPQSFPLRIQGGMLEALGINMYSTIGKCLVEFVANAYDSEAFNVGITIPFSEIQTARDKVKAEAKEEVRLKKRDPFTALLTPLPDDVAIVIEDDGHGMSPQDVEKKFLPINRKRRRDEVTGLETKLTSETGRRNVMGRKGLGKLAGFGAATKVVIRTKRKGETFATTFTLDDGTIRHAEDLGQVDIPATYEDGVDVEAHGTRITLTGLKSDAVRYTVETIASAIREAFFGIDPRELTVTINEVAIEPQKPEFVFTYPEGATLDDLAEAVVEVDAETSLPIRYVVGYHAQGKHLHTAKRGARIYCNDRLAAGPSLFGLPTGMHNFHSQSYMECIVKADELDRHGIDLVNTNRTQLREDNEIVSALIRFIEEEMRKSLAAHAKWKEQQVDVEIEKEQTARTVMRLTDVLEGKAKTTAKLLIRKLAAEHGVASSEFAEMAPLVIQSVNAGEVLIRLSELGHDPKSLQVIATNLVELADIEKSDALKNYRGKRNGINALLKLIVDGESKEMWKRKGIEKQLHQLFKEQPWLIRPEYSRYLTSDQDLGKVSTAIAAHLQVDQHFKAMDDDKRPDLVFVMSDAGAPHQINIIELKSPSLPLKNAHLTQLEGYIAKVESYCTMELRRQVHVQGYLIGAMPDDKTTADDELLLLSRMRKAGPDTQWKVVGLRLLLEQAQAAHGSVIESLKKDIEAGLADPPQPGDADDAKSDAYPEVPSEIDGELADADSEQGGGDV